MAVSRTECYRAMARISPFRHLFQTLFSIEQLMPSAEIKELNIRMNSSLKMIVPLETDEILYSLAKEVTHTSFLAFMNYLIYDRIKEFGHLKTYNGQGVIPIVFSRQVQRCIDGYLRHFEYKYIHEGPEIEAIEATQLYTYLTKYQIEREFRQRSEINSYNIITYNWPKKDRQDVITYTAFWMHAQFNPRLLGIANASPLPTVQSLINMREHIHEMRNHPFTWYNLTKGGKYCTCQYNQEQIKLQFNVGNEVTGRRPEIGESSFDIRHWNEFNLNQGPPVLEVEVPSQVISQVHSNAMRDSEISVYIPVLTPGQASPSIISQGAQPTMFNTCYPYVTNVDVNGIWKPYVNSNNQVEINSNNQDGNIENLSPRSVTEIITGSVSEIQLEQKDENHSGQQTKNLELNKDQDNQMLEDAILDQRNSLLRKTLERKSQKTKSEWQKSYVKSSKK